MKRVERLIQIGTATLAALATLMLGMGENDVTLPILALIVSASSVYVTDIKGYLRLNNSLANIAGLAALVMALIDLRRFGSENQLLAVANMLVYLQFILLYQRKSLRTYWLLALLGLLQVAVATALNFEIRFGLLMLVYMLTALGTISLLFLYGEAVQVARRQSSDANWFEPSVWNGKPSGPESSGERPDHATEDEHASRPPRSSSQTLLPRTPLSQPALTQPASSEVPRPNSRWPWLTRPSRMLGVMPRQAEEETLNWEFGRHVLKLALGTMMVSCFVFFAVPRVGRTAWSQRQGVYARHMVGASGKVTLGEFGEIIENPEAVMRVQFLDEHGTSFRVQGNPLLRGVTLTHYSNGQWYHPTRSDIARLHESGGTMLIGSVRQKTTIEALDTNVLYAVFPVSAEEEDPDVLFDKTRHNLARPVDKQHVRITYELRTAGIEGKRFREMYPSNGMPGRLYRSEVADSRLNAVLGNLATEQLAEVDPDDTLARIRSLEHMLAASGQYSYTLNLPRPAAGVDPLEHFLLRSKEGHCEYFATALALLLRNQGIASRLVVGFRCEEWNGLGNFYQVRQLHAHAWVEAYLPSDEIPADLVRLHGPWLNGAWVVLDPTPVAGQTEEAAESTFTMASIGELLDYTDFIWSSYVMGLTSRRQQEMIYQPVIRLAKRFWLGLTSAELWRARWEWIKQFWQERVVAWFGGDWFSWRAGLAASVACLLLVGLYRLAAWLLRRIWGIGLGGRDRTNPQGRLGLVFYWRLESLLARQGVIRRPGQTPRELAFAASSHLETFALTAPLAHTPQRLVETFYRVRFGGQDLDKQQRDAIEQALTALDTALARNQSAASDPTI
jgi:hypothetical protein